MRRDAGGGSGPAPIPPELPDGRSLEDARACHLEEPDGSRWRVVGLELEEGRAWVTARADEDEPEPRTFDTVLGTGAALVWEFDDGRRIRARLCERHGMLRWEGPTRPGFFEDPFLES